MSGTDLVRTVPDAQEMLALKLMIRDVAGTSLVPKAYRNKPYEILACVLTGRGLGLDPMHALRAIYIVDGKATLSTELMVALARRAGHSITGTMGAAEATAKGKRGDNGDSMEVTWTLAMAERVGLLSKDNWKNYPEAMLWSRAVSQLCRALFPDVMAAAAYVADEAELTAEQQVEQVAADLPLPDDGSVVVEEPLEGTVVENEAEAEADEQATFEIPDSAKPKGDE